MCAEILDSGYRRDFGTGAVRDAAEGKGRMDLMPLHFVGEILGSPVCGYVNDYIRTGNTDSLLEAIKHFSLAEHNEWNDMPTVMLEVSHLFEDGCKKYGDRNWEKGIPIHCYIDSGCRHLMKYLRGDTDERHDRAFVWNMMCAVWTHYNHPNLRDLPFNAKKESSDESATG